ncbi:MAG: efflux RND transporter permease subunit [Lachnospiraceae bacterium]
MGITKFALKRPVTTFLAILCLIVFGYQAITDSKLELSPDMDMSMLIVYTSYSGASPEDINDLITKPIEEKVNTLSGLDSISSTSSEGTSMIMLSYEYGTDMDEAYDDLKKKVDEVEHDLPDDSNSPIIIEINSNSGSSISMVVDYPGKENLYDYVNNDIVPEFEKISTVAEVTTSGGASEYVRVDLNEEKMDQYGVTLSSIASDIEAATIAYPAGTALVGSQELSVSTRMKYDELELLQEIPISTGTDDTVYLIDVASVYTTTKDNASIARYNGNDTISVNITKQQSATAMEVSDSVKEVIDTLHRSDANLEITIIDDEAESIKNSLWSVVETLLMAIGLSMIILWLFFGDLKASLIVGSSIPVSVLVALILMKQMDISLNVITLCALTLGVGMMVDNSIVVLESCFRVTAERPSGFVEYMKDALEGTDLVFQSILGGTLTTCVVFLPLAQLTGMTGQLFGPLGYTIVFCLGASLLSAISIVPLCYVVYRPTEHAKAPLSKPVTKLQDSYRAAMRVILPKKKTVMGISIILLIISFRIAGELGMELMASDDEGEVEISVEMRPGILNSDINEVLKGIEEIIIQHEDIDSYMTTAGSGGMMSRGDASITAYLKDERKMSTNEVAKQWENDLADITNANVTVDVSGSMSMMSSFGENYEVILRGANYDEVVRIADKIVNDLMEREEVTQVHSDAENDSPVIEITVDAVRATAAGLTASEIGNAVYQAVSGMEATEIEINGENVSVMVEYPKGSYESLDQIKNIVLSTKRGGKVQLTDVADVGFQDSPASIEREDKQYVVTVTAEYTAIATGETAGILDNEVVKPNLSETVTTGMNSTMKTMVEEFTALAGAIALAIFLVFVVMAAQFESLKFSFMVMVTIPFSLIGSFGLLWLTDCKISMVSLIGFMMLIGTVVNSGILYVETVNQYRDTMDRDTALIEAGATRLRPILMTTMTTVISMIPMAMALGNSGAMTQGLAVVNIGGLTASTILSLLMLPVFYTIISGNPEEQRKREEKKLKKAQEKEKLRRKKGDSEK